MTKGKRFFPPKHHWKGAGFTCEPSSYIRCKAWMRVGSRGSAGRVMSWGNVPCWQEHTTQSIQCLSSVGKAKPCSGGSRGPARFPRESRSKWVTSMCKDCSCSFFPSDDYSLRLTTWQECLPKVANLFPWAVPTHWRSGSLTLVRCPPSEWAHPTWFRFPARVSPFSSPFFSLLKSLVSIPGQEPWGTHHSAKAQVP